jgi:organic hydroperoxide reductase OsmC/OhrA
MTCLEGNGARYQLGTIGPTGWLNILSSLCSLFIMLHSVKLTQCMLFAYVSQDVPNKQPTGTSLMEKQHTYEVTIEWTGNQGTGTSSYRDYARSFVAKANQKKDISCSSDPAFLGDPKCWNPEELFLASVSSCHQLWYLHLCAVNHVQVMRYQDTPIGLMTEADEHGKGRFISVTLKPIVYITKYSSQEKAFSLHQDAHRECFIANSLNVETQCDPTILVLE